MNERIVFLIVVILISNEVLFAQKTIEIKGLDQPNFISKKCNKYFNLYKQLPADLRYGVEIIDRDIFITFRSDSISRSTRLT